MSNADSPEEQPYDFKQELSLIAWRHSRDATIEGIWRTFRKYWKSQGMQFPCEPLFCVDRQSGENRTVLVVVPDGYPQGQTNPFQTALKGVPCPWVRNLSLPSSCIKSTFASILSFELEKFVS